MTQEMVRGFSLFEEALLVSEAQEPNVEQCTKDAAAIQNVIQCYHVIYNEKKRANTQSSRASQVAQSLKCVPAMRETWVQSLGWEDPLEKETATHSSILAWRIPWKEEPGGLQSMGLQSWTELSDFTFTLTQSSLDHFFKRVQFSSVAQSCPTLCDPVTCSSLGFPVHHQLPELTQTHVKWVDRAESSKEPEPVPSVSSMSDTAACPPLFADDPSALPSPTLSLLQSVTLVACPLDASPSVPGAVLYYCTF